mgnify:CR=1 FL=1
MNTKRNIKAMLAAFALLFVLLAAYLVYITDAYGPYWFASPYNTRVSKQKSLVTAGDMTDRNGVLLASTGAEGERSYSPNEALRLATAHAVGDGTGMTLGAQALFSRYLLGFEQSVGERVQTLFSKEKRRGCDVRLTLDAQLCAFARALLGENHGAIVVMNYKTGEVLAMTASPAFDPAKMGGYSTGEYALEDGSMVNRATMGRYTPGSTFKLVTTIAALRYLPNAQSRTFTCAGPLMFDKKTGKLVSGVAEPLDENGNVKEGYALLRDFEDEVHGELTLMEAFAHSCNNTFARIALEIGPAKLVETAESLGVNGEYLFEELVAYAGTMEAAKTDFELAWSGVGQHTDIMTPMQLCLIASAIANDGVMMEPKLLLSAVKPSGAEAATLESEAYQTLLKGNEAEYLQACMALAVKSGTGKRAAVEGLTVCGKTGTAEVSSTGKYKPHAWFVGFVENEAYPYAVCVVVENGGGGGAVAAPIAGKLLERAAGLAQPLS